MSRSRDARFSIDDAFEEEDETAAEEHRQRDQHLCKTDDESGSESLMRSPWGGCWWRHPKVREKWRTVCAAAALLIVGVALAAVGVYVSVYGHFTKAAVFLAAGLICLLPGGYHVVYVWLAATGRRGYDFYRLPLFT